MSDELKFERLIVDIAPNSPGEDVVARLQGALYEYEVAHYKITRPRTPVVDYKAERALATAESFLAATSECKDLSPVSCLVTATKAGDINAVMTLGTLRKLVELVKTDMGRKPL